MSWTLSTAPDMSGKVVVITGCTSGIGQPAAKHLAHLGAHVIMGCRNASKMSAVASQIRSEKPSTVTELLLDVSDFGSVRSFATKFAELGLQIDVLLLNAGVITKGFRASKQGCDMLFATNHFGHWLLTGLLLPHLQDGARVISVSSIGHRYAHEIDYDIILGKTDGKGYMTRDIYFQSKLANLWFTQHLNKLLQTHARERRITAVGCHPGVSFSQLAREMVSPAWLREGLYCIGRILLQGADMGSLPLVMAATDMELTKACYYGPCGWFEVRGSPKRECVLAKHVFDEEKAGVLWGVSEEVCGFRYGF